jgi:hypothetical protein
MRMRATHVGAAALLAAMLAPQTLAQGAGHGGTPPAGGHGGTPPAGGNGGLPPGMP